MKAWNFFAAGTFALLLAGCRRDMADQPHAEPMEANAFFADGAASRPLPANTIARGELREDTLFFTGHNADGSLSEVFPQPVTAADLARGRERYDIFCAVCHGATGDGQGMIVQRGFPTPPSLNIDRLRTAPVGHFVEAIEKGYGLMYSYASRVPPRDRWAIAAYLRVLQTSQEVKLAELSAEERAKLEAMP